MDDIELFPLAEAAWKLARDGGAEDAARPALEEIRERGTGFLMAKRAPWPAVRYTFIIVARTGEDVFYVILDGKRDEGASAGVPPSAVDAALKALPPPDGSKPEPLRKLLAAEGRLIAALLVGQTWEGETLAAMAHHRLLTREQAAWFLRGFIRDQTAKAVRIN